jgi:hypothetical protein
VGTLRFAHPTAYYEEDGYRALLFATERAIDRALAA